VLTRKPFPRRSGASDGEPKRGNPLERREGPFPLHLGPGVFSPTTTSRTLADAIEITPGDTVIDVGCGSGVLAIVAAKLGAAKVYGVDLVPAGRGGRQGRTLADSGSITSANSAPGSARAGADDVQANVLDRATFRGSPTRSAKESGWFDDVPARPTGAELPAKFLRSIGDTLAMGGRLYLPTGRSNTSRPSWTPRTRSSVTTCGSCSNAEFPLPGSGRQVEGRRTA
jgi:protein-L-isoaspartate O-methyltransferase